MLNEYYNKNESFVLFRTLHQNVIGLFSGIRQMFVISIGAYLIFRGQLSIGTLLAFNQIMLRTSQPVQLLSNISFVYKDMLSSFERILPFIRYDGEKQEILVNGENQIHLECRNISFDINNLRIFNNLNIVIKRSEKLAVTGKSGSGKSILCKIIAGIYKAEGEVVIHTNKTNNYIGFIVDESSIVSGSLEENLTYGWEGKLFSQEELRKVLELVGLNINYDEPNWHKRVINKNILSRGEQQRIELARLMLFKPEIIILDEPTSGLLIW